MNISECILKFMGKFGNSTACKISRGTGVNISHLTTPLNKLVEDGVLVSAESLDGRKLPITVYTLKPRAVT